MLSEGYDFFCWNYEGQTKMKHEVLQDYIDNWIKIVGCHNNLNYFDCYGGCGAYKENDKLFFGSPIRVAMAIEKNQKNLHRNVNIIIIEKDKDNIENLKKVFKHNQIGIIPHYVEGDFDENINKILDRTKGSLVPTFFFIDPFGFTIKYSTLKRIMSIPKSEIFLNFMYTRINEFLSCEKLESTLSELFGCEDWKSIINQTTINREQKIVELFREQLKKISKYAYYYRMSYPNKKRTYYYLFHLTNHSLGCTIMKSSFAKYNYGKVEYMGPLHGQMDLFDRGDIKIDEIKQYFLERYNKVERTFTELIEENIDAVPYLESDIRGSIQELRKAGLVNVIMVDSKSHGLKGRDRIIFN